MVNLLPFWQDHRLVPRLDSTFLIQLRQIGPYCPLIYLVHPLNLFVDVGNLESSTLVVVSMEEVYN